MVGFYKIWLFPIRSGKEVLGGSEMGELVFEYVNSNLGVGEAWGLGRAGWGGGRNVRAGG